MIPELPVEIHQKIYAMACTDDGKTGCALSLVSRRVNEVSANYRWYSLAVSGKIQVFKLLCALEEHAQEDLDVAHLCVSDIDPSGGDQQDWEEDSDDSEDDDWDVSSFDSLDSAEILRALMKANSRTRPTPKVGSSLAELLELVAPTLQTLSITLFVTRPSHGRLRLPDLEFPRLEELSLRGNHRLPWDTGFAPMLKRLNIGDECIPPRLEDNLATCYPDLTHLRISRFLKVRDHMEVVKRLLVVMNVWPLSEAEQLMILDKKLSVLPSNATRWVLVEPGPTNYIPAAVRRNARHANSNGNSVWRVPRSYFNMVDQLTRFAHDLPNFACLPKNPGRDQIQEANNARIEWLERIEGGLGCWYAPGKEIS